VPRRSLVSIAFVLASSAMLLACDRSDPVEGGTLHIIAPSLPRIVDPQLTRGSPAREAFWVAYIPLLTYAHVPAHRGLRVIPGLATDMPRVSDDGRTYSLRIHGGLRYSDGEPIEASDFEHAVKRLLLLDPRRAGAFGGIAGAGRFQARGRGDIPGIRAVDRRGRIVIRLRRPRPGFEAALASLRAAPVPKTTPLRAPSAGPPPTSGPYAFSEFDPARELAMRRNPHWEANQATGIDVPDGHVDRIEIAVVPRIAEELSLVGEDRADLMLAQLPPAQALRLSEDDPGRFRIEEDQEPRMPTTYVSEQVRLTEVYFHPLFGHDLTSFEFQE
jgi:peptide/nickel transport system substrate-binding protein